MNDAEKREATELQTTVKLNLAACLLKVDKPQRAVEELDLVCELSCFSKNVSVLIILLMLLGN